ncbi:hypothetical protein [Pyrococcus abyssi]|uniref:Uncharacterized protein n=1 Tax=Pyrococcus abyssi (strain GE5 / Orsay) TaxID=272844 RepID=Q9V206_PYRAB|nr:hypothetical protein [Pyrococcus abyssi]CAB49192.1 Hypothetical protein PAB0182 [Pyrococcus abyssi GE5]CCE69645.1 TPA: hypothetical protein PAB0182 [Pyrococcus abyssi GE5]
MRKIITLGVVLVIFLIGYSTLSLNSSLEERKPTIDQIVSEISSYSSFCWIVNGTSLSVPLFRARAKSVKACINYSNGSAIYWVRDEGGKDFSYQINMDELDWDIVVHSVWPELNIMNFLKWILENGNVTEVKRVDEGYEFHVLHEYKEESNAGTLENPRVVEITIVWNVTLVVNDNGKLVGGHFIGKSIGPSNVNTANWVQEGNFSILRTNEH